MPLVSVIVPVYNVEKYIYRCIDSILMQTLQDIEIILVNDGSTDRSSQICNEYNLKDNRIKVIHKINGGLSDARNIGIEVARGEYIAFLDSDDWVETDFYEYLYNLIKREDSDIVQCDYIKAYKENSKIDRDIVENISIYNGVEALDLLYGEEYIKTAVVWNKLYDRTLFYDIRFPKGKIHEDEFTTYKLLHKATKVVNSNIPMVYYRQREGSIMSQAFSEKRLDALEAWKERIDYFEEYGLDKLVKKTECTICQALKLFYMQVEKSDLINKKKILKFIKNDMRKNYISYIKNPYITNRSKLTLTICLLNGQVFCTMHSAYKNIGFKAKKEYRKTTKVKKKL